MTRTVTEKDVLSVSELAWRWMKSPTRVRQILVGQNSLPPDHPRKSIYPWRLGENGNWHVSRDDVETYEKRHGIVPCR